MGLAQGWACDKAWAARGADIHQNGFVIEKGCFKTAELLKKERKDSYTLKAKKDEKISKTFSSLISHYVQMELDSVSSNLVCDYMKNHENPKIQKSKLAHFGLKSSKPAIVSA